MTSKLSGYPEVFIEIAMRAFQEEPIAPLKVASERDSYPQLHRFNRFRNILVTEGHPFALAAKDLIARRECVDGQWLLTFTPAGLYERTVFKPSETRPAEPSETRVATAQPDVSEAFFTKWLAENQPKQPPSVDCAHDWGELSCLLCGEPRVD